MDNIQIINQRKEAGNQLVFSYLTLRKLIGIGGMLLPAVIAVFPSRPSKYYGFEFSISDYYYTDRGDFLVVILCVIGAFLITYKGYSRMEMALTALAGICGIGVAFVPTGKACEECLYSVHNSDGGLFNSLTGSWWHLAFAGTFFLCLGVLNSGLPFIHFFAMIMKKFKLLKLPTTARIEQTTNLLYLYRPIRFYFLHY